ncbi:MAG TPA: hypothetical protein VM013_09435 [Dehalococcoidia bacterium]|nr:hypothetical protein [Dehalococcoidia bacterium]
MRWLWLAAVVALTLLGASCGGGGGAGDAAPLLTDDDLREMVVLSSSGLPWEITPQEDSAKSDEQAAGDFLDAGTWLQNYQRWGRTGGHQAAFAVSGSDMTAVETQVESYESSDGATDAFAALRGFLASPDAVSTFEAQGFSGIHIDEVNAESVGDQSAGYSIRVVASSRAYDTFIVLFRRGVIVATASVGAPTGDIVLGDVDAAAKALDSRIQSVLGR